MAEITIIGAGVAGLAVATELAARGITPRLHDLHPAPGPQSCSWWAGGMLAPFCEGEAAEPAVMHLGQEAATWWARHAGGVTRAGTLVVALARDRGELARFARRTQGHHWLDADAVAVTEPDLAGRVPEALFFADEAHLDPRRAMASLAARLAERGIGIEPAAAVQAGRVIDCRGLAARDVLADLRGVKGEMALLRCLDITLSRPVRLLHPRHPIYIVPRGDGVFMLGATQIEAGERGRVTARSLLELLSAAYALHPAFGEAEVLEIGADARPAFGDNLPRLRDLGGILHVNGLFRHGFLLAPALARMAADWCESGQIKEMIDES